MHNKKFWPFDSMIELKKATIAPDMTASEILCISVDISETHRNGNSICIDEIKSKSSYIVLISHN